MTISDYYLNARPYSKYLNITVCERDFDLNAFIYAELKNDVGEIPLMLVNDVIENKEKTKFIASIIGNKNAIKRHQLSPILKDFTVRLPSECVVQKVITGKNDIYYGGWGLILDEDMNPLYMENLVIERGVFNKHSTGIATGIVFRISPKVFTENGLLHRAISKNFIPGIATNDYSNSICKVFALDRGNSILKKDIIISDDNPFILKPVMPKSINVNEELNALLKSAV